LMVVLVGLVFPGYLYQIESHSHSMAIVQPISNNNNIHQFLRMLLEYTFHVLYQQNGN
jgi:uncharacterized membrane protein affecting hemolysin expression